ncbi:uncharacterized protein [Haliotis asinina]|uniref:uncharacterized protein n=1 Tax=Haliotis asinina TaxID=109174 RepID=UPI003531C41D
MATSLKLTEHFLTCIICTEVFVDPCTLVCYHTFCRKCVINYTKTRPEAINAKSLMCPFCSKMTKVSDPGKPVEKWADDVKPSFVMQGLLDSFGPESKDTTFCVYCKEGGETTPAGAWCSVCDDALCEKCVRVHSRIPATRHHDVTDLSGEVKVKRRRKVMCTEHKEECMEFLCKDCKKTVCQKCCIIYHRKCNSVATIESQIETMRNELQKTTKTLSKKRRDTKSKTNKLKSTVNIERFRYAQMEEDIMSVTQEAIQQITFKGKQLLDNLKEMSHTHIGQLKACIKSRQLSVQMYQQQTELIDQALQSECDMDVYEMYQGCDAGGVEAVGDTDDGGIVRVTYRNDTEKLSKALEGLQLGVIEVLYDGDVDLAADPVLQDTINVRVPEECNAAQIANLAVMMVDGTDTVVITDPVNESVKSFYTRNNRSCHSRLSLTNFPYGLTKLTHKQVAVTVPRKNQIVTVGVNPDLELLSTITTSKQYWDATCLNPSTLAASSLVPPCVDILGMKGNVLKSFNPHDNGKIFWYPTNLCTTKTGHILLSDRASKGVACLTPEGEIVFHYRPTGDTALMDPRGITSTCRGDILVTDSSLHRVIHLTEAGDFVRNLLTDEDGIHDPVGMATSQKLTEHFLTCIICTEVFVDPCTLVCYHTFCRKCVINFTKTRPEAINAKSLICPFCSKMTKVSDPEKPVEEWADDVKPSFVMQGLLDSFGPESKDSNSCAFCKEGAETTPAAVWCSVCDDALCEKCVRVHSRIPATRNHDVTDLRREVKVKRRRKVMCKEHKQEWLEFLCEDCEKTICQKCCIIYHRKCDSVVTIESQVETMRTELQMNKEALSKKQEDTTSKMDDLKSILGKETSRYAQIEEYIVSVTQGAIQQITFKGKQLLDNLKEMSDIHMGKLKARIKSRDLLVQMYQQQTELIDQALQSECDMDVYEMYQGCDAGGVEFLGDAENGRIVRVTFRHDMGKLRKALDDLQLGTIGVLYDGDVDLAADPVLEDIINVRVAGDKFEPRINDLTVMVVDDTETVVVTDCENTNVKSFYTRDYQPCHSMLCLRNCPESLTRLTDNQVAVTVPVKNQIVIVGVNPDLELVSTITTSKAYWGIAYLNPSRLAASSSSPPCVDILNMTGNVIMSLRSPKSSNTIFQDPSYLCTTRTGHILMSDWMSKYVSCLTLEGKIISFYRPTGDTALMEPRGITSICRGDILVTDSSLHKVIHLTEKGEFVRNLLTDEDDIDTPVVVDVDGRGRMYVGLYYEGVVKVYMC